MPAKVETIPALPGLSSVGGKPVIARFDGGHLSSDGGLLVLREVERRLDVAGRLAACIMDPRDPERVSISSGGPSHSDTSCRRPPRRRECFLGIPKN